MIDLNYLICWDPGNRGISKIFPEYEKRNPNFTKKSAKKIMNNLENVIIIVGFPINTKEKSFSGETDGPLGSIQLHRAIKDLGGNSKILTINPYFKAINSMADEVLTVDEISNVKPSALISIEFPGKNPNGYYDLNGNSVYTEEIEKINKFFQKSKCPKISIGDGGNELGMGNIKNLVKKEIKNGDEIFSKVETDNLVISGTSNWGAYGIISELSALNNRNLLHNIETEEKMLEKCLDNGLVDGVTKKSKKSVDGIPLRVLKSFLNLLRKRTDWKIMKSY